MLNKVQLIGHLGKDPDVRTLDGGSRYASWFLLQLKKGIHYKMELRYRREQNGIISLCGKDLRKWLGNTCTRVTRFTWRGKSERAVTRTTTRSSAI